MFTLKSVVRLRDRVSWSSVTATHLSYLPLPRGASSSTATSDDPLVTAAQSHVCLNLPKLKFHLRKVTTE